MNNHAVIADSAKMIEEALRILAGQKTIENTGYYDSADMFGNTKTDRLIKKNKIP